MDAMLSCRGVTKRYGETTALADADFDVDGGEVRGLVGHNGAGKSTLLRCILGLVRPDAGRIQLLGRDRTPKAGRQLDGVAGLVDGTRWPGSMRVESVLNMLAAYDHRPRARVGDVIDALSIGHLKRTRVSALSLGGRQRLGVAAALLREPKLLLLDEPVNGLDPEGRRDLRELLRHLAQDGAAVVISSHDLAEISATCDTVTKLDNGAVSWTSPLSEVAHTALRRVGLSTSDDAAALTLLAKVANLQASMSSDDKEIELRGSADALDEASLAIGVAGIAIRRWEPQSRLAAAMLPDDTDHTDDTDDPYDPDGSR